MNNYLFHVKTTPLFKLDSHGDFGKLDSLLCALVKNNVIKCDNELLGIGRPYSEYTFHMESDNDMGILAILHSISSNRSISSVKCYCIGSEMNVMSLYRKKNLAPQDILLNVMYPYEVAVVKYLSERDGIKCEPEFSELYGHFSNEEVDTLLKKASVIFNKHNRGILT